MVGCDVGSFYLYCSDNEMPCGKEIHVEFVKPGDFSFVRRTCDLALNDLVLNQIFAWKCLSPGIFVPFFDRLNTWGKQNQKDGGKKNFKGTKKLLEVMKVENICSRHWHLNIISSWGGLTWLVITKWWNMHQKVLSLDSL